MYIRKIEANFQKTESVCDMKRNDSYLLHEPSEVEVLDQFAKSPRMSLPQA